MWLRFRQRVALLLACVASARHGSAQHASELPPLATPPPPSPETPLPPPSPSPPSPSPSPSPPPSPPLAPPPCTNEGTDRYAGKGACCAGLVEVVEPRDLENWFACAEDDPEHGITCYSTIIKCRLLVPPHTPPQPAAPPPPGCERDVQGSYGDARDGAAAA